MAIQKGCAGSRLRVSRQANAQAAQACATHAVPTPSAPLLSMRPSAHVRDGSVLLCCMPSSVDMLRRATLAQDCTHCVTGSRQLQTPQGWYHSCPQRRHCQSPNPCSAATRGLFQHRLGQHLHGRAPDLHRPRHRAVGGAGAREAGQVAASSFTVLQAESDLQAAAWALTFHIAHSCHPCPCFDPCRTTATRIRLTLPRCGFAGQLHRGG